MVSYVWLNALHLQSNQARAEAFERRALEHVHYISPQTAISHVGRTERYRAGTHLRHLRRHRGKHFGWPHEGRVGLLRHRDRFYVALVAGELRHRQPEEVTRRYLEGSLQHAPRG